MIAREMVGARVPIEWKNRLDEIAKEQNKYLSQIVYEAISKYLEASDETSMDTKVREILKLPEVLEGNPVITSLSDAIQAFEAKLATFEKLLPALHEASQEERQDKVQLTSEQLAIILGVTSRAVNTAASKGQEYFTQWTKKRKKGGAWTFVVINPGMKKVDRRFFQI